MRCLYLLLLVPVVACVWILGFWEITFASLGILGFSLTANSLGLLPGTRLYSRRCELKEAEWALEKARIERVRTRMRMLESEELNRTLALPPGKEDA